MESAGLFRIKYLESNTLALMDKIVCHLNIVV